MNIETLPIDRYELSREINNEILGLSGTVLTASDIQQVTDIKFHVNVRIRIGL